MLTEKQKSEALFKKYALELATQEHKGNIKLVKRLLENPKIAM